MSSVKGMHGEDPPRKSRASVVRTLRVLLLVSAAATLAAFLPTPWSLSHTFRASSAARRTADPADEWRDDVWPLRQPESWDISTDFPHPRTLSYDVQEGTWLRLDVSKDGDIVFDMLGDLYCLPAGAYSDGALAAGAVARARPVLLGVPHDSDPHFSPDGTRLVFRSDAELGVENIWVAPWAGCEQQDLRPADGGRADLVHALTSKLDDEELLAGGVRETGERRRSRLIREGRLDAYRVTNETYRTVTDPRFHPSGAKIVATKWYTSERSLGAGEGWEYHVPSPRRRIEPDSGKRLVGRTLPAGWDAADYGDQQVGPEQLVWLGDDSVIYAKNVVDTDGQFTYSKDVHKGIYAIFARNLTTGRTETVVGASPGGASRPELSHDGRTLAFVRRVRDKEALVLKDLVTGTLFHVWHGLTYDLSTVSAPMGTYPSFAFTPEDSAIIIWAAGQIWRVPLARTASGERSGGGAPKRIPFTAHIEKRLAETRRATTDVRALETAATQRVHAFKELQADERGARVLFQGAGVSYLQRVADAQHRGGASLPARVPVLHPDAPYYSPTFVRGADDLVLHARWSDVDFSAFEIANVTSGRAYALAGLPRGRYHSPVLCECAGRTRLLAFVKTAGDLLTGNVVATAKPGLYIARITLPDADTEGDVQLEDVRFVASWISPSDRVQLRFVNGASKLVVQQSQRAFVINVATGPNEFGEYEQHTLAEGRMSSELAVAPTEGKSVGVAHAAFVDFFHVYVAADKKIDLTKPLWSKPGNATKGLARVSLDGGHDITWSKDGKKLFWFLGPYLHSLEVSKLGHCSSAIAKDPANFGISCTKGLLEYQEVIVRHSTDISRLNTDAYTAASSAGNGNLTNAPFVAIVNATILTLEGSSAEKDLIREGTLFIRNGVIEEVLYGGDVVIPWGATIIDAEGGYVIPGFIDAHAHWGGFDSKYPARSWEMETFLAYGVTTLHNPSADTVTGFIERSRLESGQLIGPRIFQVGDIIYGAGAEGIHQDIVDMEEAHAALLRIKVEGGPASFSYKNYQLPSRASRQRLLLAARNLSMICVPEGGMAYDWDLTYIVDGMTTIEHPIPVPVLYDDVLTLYALSGTGATPTHIVNYGGAWGEQMVWATEDIPNDPKLRQFVRHDNLELLSESTARPRNSFALFNTSSTIARMVQKGLRTHIGAHGEPPLGLNYHAEMWFTRQGGLSNYETLRAATSDAAITLGLYPSLGSITAGKLADLLIYPPGIDLLEDDIRSTRDIKYVVRGGRIWEAQTLTEVWPRKGRREPLPPFNAE